MSNHDLYRDLDGKVLESVRNHYDPLQPASWPYYIIEMPLTKDGHGPAEYPDVHEMTFEVWDRICGSHGSFSSVHKALVKALALNAELMGEPQ